MNPPHTVFFGTPEFAARILQGLFDHVSLKAVVTQPDKPRGRGRHLLPPPVKTLAQSRNIPVFQPARARDPLFFESLSRLEPELIVTAAYGRILPPAILDLPRYRCVNVHASLLPAYRGAAPVNWALINGEAETGITLMRMDEGLDTGPLLARRALPILPEDNVHTLTNRLAELGSAMLPETIEALLAGRSSEKPQPEDGASVAPMLRKNDGRVDWSWSAARLHNLIRGCFPWPGAFTFLNGRRTRLITSEVRQGSGAPGQVAAVDKSTLLVGTGEGLLSIMEIQSEGKGRTPIQAFLQGHRLKPGDRFSETPEGNT